jgi:putative hydrolase of the HAD superfamily
MIPAERIDGIVFDLDGTLYRDDGREMEAAYERAGVAAALAAGAALNVEEALLVARESFAIHGYYAKGFVPHGVEETDFHFRFHAALETDAIGTVDGLHEALSACGTDRFVIATHSSRDWASRAVGHLLLGDTFPAARVIVLEDCGFRDKRGHEEPFRKALAILGTEPSRTAVIEDSARNLTVPKRLGMPTVLVNYRDPARPKPPHVDVQTGSIVEALELIGRINHRGGA